MRVNRESLPRQGRNQPGKAIEPCRSGLFTGCRSAINRSFVDPILNNTPPALGDRNSRRLNLISRKTHFCSRLNNGHLFVTGTRTRQPQSVFATQLPSEMSPKRPFPRTIPQALTFSRKIWDGYQPCSSTTANVLGYVRSLLNHRQEKKRQNWCNWHVFSDRPTAIRLTMSYYRSNASRNGNSGACGRVPPERAPWSGRKARPGRKFDENSLCTG